MHLKYISSTRIFSSRFTKIFLLFCACAFIGSSIGKIVSHNTARQTAASAQSSNWGLSFQEEGKRPVGNATIEELAQYNAFFAEDTEEKKIYLTFDAGFENGNTPAILDALKKHQAPATFFVVGNFISENKDLIKRMETEGHIVGNHTMTHPDMSKISTKESFQKELSDVEKIYREITGKEMTKFYRPPQGIYSTQNLSMARELGYHTFFWSLAYVDWYQDFRMISACYAIDHALRAPKKASTRAAIYRDFGSNPVVALCWTIETNTSRSVLMVACRPPKVKNKMTHTTAQAAPHA